MEDKVMIGETLTRKSLISFLLLVLVFGIVGAVCIYNVLRVYFLIPFQYYMLMSILTFVIIILFLMPLASGSNERIVFDNKYMSYFHTKGYINQFKEVIRIILNRKEKPSIQVKINDLQKLDLSYLGYLGFRGHTAYRLKMTFFLKNGDSFYLLPLSYGQMEKGDYEKAFSLLENQNIEVVDKYGLRPYLNKIMYDFQEYISTLNMK